MGATTSAVYPVLAAGFAAGLAAGFAAGLAAGLAALTGPGLTALPVSARCWPGRMRFGFLPTTLRLRSYRWCHPPLTWWAAAIFESVSPRTTVYVAALACAVVAALAWALAVAAAG